MSANHEEYACHPRVVIRKLGICLKVAQLLQSKLINSHDCGWFDGGCYTLAEAVVSVVPGTEIYYVSRTIENRDHAVVKVVGVELYFDADGIATDGALFKKMKEEEQVECSFLAPFHDFHKKRKFIFKGIKHAFIEEYKKVAK